MKKNEFVGCDPLGTAKYFVHIGKKQEANEILDMLLPYCQTVDQLDQIGYVYTTNRNFKRGLEIALKLYPRARNGTEMWDMRVNLIRSYLNLNNPKEALRYINANKAINPLDQPNLMDEAYALFLLNKKDEGEKILRKILENPESEDVHNRCLFNLGSYDLRNGNFKTGMKNFLLNGRKMEVWKSLELPNRPWQGETIPGATIVQVAEGGFGDELINIRFQKHIKDRGMNPVWYTDRKDMAKLFTDNGFTVITSLSDVKPEWMWNYSMLIPVLLDLDEEELWYGPYIKPIEPKQFTKKIGIKVSGNPEYDQDLARSIPLNEFVDAIPEQYEIYSFHNDEVIEHPRVINWMDSNTTWDDTIKMINEMDVIASSCTSLPHASGAMGQKTFILVPILKYYLWSNDKSHSPWYSDDVEILHQETPNCWNVPLNTLKERLTNEIR